MSNTCETEIIEEIIEEYDDKGVLCRYTEKDGWVPIEDCCEKCGYVKCMCSINEFWVSHEIKQQEIKEQGLCIICEDDEATEFHRGDGYCESCAIDNWKLIMQDMADEEDRINAEEDEEEDDDTYILCNNCVKNIHRQNDVWYICSYMSGANERYNDYCEECFNNKSFDNTYKIQKVN